MDAWIDLFKSNPFSCTIALVAGLIMGWIIIRILNSGGGNHRR
jgi:hypothetical protein